MAKLYREGFEACFGQATELVYNRLGWSGAQAAALAAVLGAGYARKLKEFYLGVNRIGVEGARALAQALPGVPALEKLECASPARPPALMQRIAYVHSPSGGHRLVPNGQRPAASARP